MTTALLGSRGTLGANKIDWERARLACADVGIEPGTSAFDQCVANLYDTPWQEQNSAAR
jgi:hypothetical protein